jgi:hypothetical protein
MRKKVSMKKTTKFLKQLIKNHYIDVISVLILILSLSACSAKEPILKSNQTQSLTSTPVATPTTEVGTVRSNPFPVGSTLKSEGESIQILEVNHPAEESSLLFFSEMPNDDQDLIHLKINLSCSKDEDKICNVSYLDFKLLGKDGIVHDATTIPSYYPFTLKDILDNVEIYGGGSIECSLIFIIQETNIIDYLLIYEPFDELNKYYIEF